MRLLVLNPNTSQFVTDRVVETARAAAGPECRVTGVTGRRGPPIVGTRSECVMAAAEALDLAAEHAGDADGILLAISFDTGLDALREMLPIPVVGMSEAGMLAAMTLARRFSLLTFGNRAVPIYEELVAHYGWTGRSAGVLSLPPLTEAQLRDTSLVLPDLAAAITTAAQDRGTEAVVLAGAVFAGLTGRLRDMVPVPVVDGVVAAVHQLQMLHAMAPAKPTAGSLAFPPAKPLSGMSPALTRRFGDFPAMSPRDNGKDT
ncbi:MAG: aspartate/glutamate racemase family protein [Albidovulum sp.]|jgi:allantoin racemase